MIRTAKVLFCCNEHGATASGSVMFPDPSDIDERFFIEPKSIKVLWREAKAVGWTRDRRGNYYCDQCTEYERERE